MATQETSETTDIILGTYIHLHPKVIVGVLETFKTPLTHEHLGRLCYVDGVVIPTGDPHTIRK